MITASGLPAPAARLVGVGVDFDGRPALRHVDLEIRPGELTVLAGPNGAGKSTLIEVIAGALPPSSGHVERAARSVAFVPQRAAVPERLPVTVRDVVAIGTWGREARRRRPAAAAGRAIDHAMARLGLDALARARFGALSGGQRQRALLAQGLARGAELLLLDEPTTGLDAESAFRIRSVLAEESARGAAVVCVSHDDSVIGRADRLLRLQDGRVTDGLRQDRVGVSRPPRVR